MAAMTAQKSAPPVKALQFPFDKAIVGLHKGKPVIDSLTISREFLALRAQVKI